MTTALALASPPQISYIPLLGEWLILRIDASDFKQNYLFLNLKFVEMIALNYN